MIAVDLYAGLGGWAEGLLAEGWDVVGFDIERHRYGAHRYPAQLVLQDVLTLHGSQFREAGLIVASPPCQEYSYMAMPWSRAKARAAAIRADETGQLLSDLNRLFDACFRIQAQASLAAGRHIPMVVENVRGAQPWVGRARWNFGSFYLWGDVPALMPVIGQRKVAAAHLHLGGGNSFLRAPGDTAEKRSAARYAPRHAERRAKEGSKNTGGSWFNIAHNTTSGHGQNPDGRALKGRMHGWSGGDWEPENGTKMARQWWTDGSDALSARTSSNSPARKAASAMIAKIPLPLASHIAAVYRL